MYSFLANYEILPFDEKDAVCFGRLRAMLTNKGAPIGAYDVMLAAQCVAKDLTIVTHNTKEFSRIAFLKIEDWAI